MSTLTALVAAPGSQPVTHLGARLVWTGITLLAVVLVAALMYRGWVARGRRQADVPPLPELPEDLGDGYASAEGVYVSTTTEGDWLDRVVARGLGVRSQAVMTVAELGVLLERAGAPDVFVPADALRGLRLTKGIAGKFVEEDGIVVLTWEHGPYRLDTGFRTRHAVDRDVLVEAVSHLVPQGAS